MSPFFPFPLASHFDLPGSESVFGLPQGPLIGVHASLSQDGFQRRGYGWTDTTPLLTSKELSSWEGLLDFKNEKYVVFYLLSWQGPESSINPAFMGFLLLWNFCPRGESVQPGAYLSSSFFFFFPIYLLSQYI